MIPRAAAELAASLRAQGVAWTDLRDELARLGFGLYTVPAISRAVGDLLLQQLAPPKVPLPDPDLLVIDAGWRAGWAEQFPGEPYPGLVEARRRIRAKLFTGGRA